ncbi:LANO_0H04390g1_1 [Lachancea nothofagi CBS 11611]|uniref:Histone chaperone RTT106 n=1 Tax=Lachancea nothofagi CBS 11611 TaxID=1266666 RepID=A0A1G4KLJ9_9SACH|nr:LANO_0H04390g1_1 [Lachancea nothofagi CBS 11611]
MAALFLNSVPRELREKIEQVCFSNPLALDVFEELYQYTRDTIEVRKKTKSESVNSEVLEDSVIFQLKDVSVLTPFRKKLNLVISVSPVTGKPTLSLSKDMTPQLTISELNKGVKFATFLPFPEKANVVYLFICYNQGPEPNENEFVLVTMNKDVTLKQFVTSGLLTSEVNDFSYCIDYIRKQAILVGFRISDPFSVSTSGPKSFHVEAHRGTKEGTLYFLPDHVLFGFKKPILLFSSQEIESITYSSITRLTFNVTLITKNGDKFEFSMIDQNEFTLIDDYVKRKQVIDNSMSEENKAKTAHKDQNAAEHSSLLAEAAQQLKGEGQVSEIPLESDDEEADVDFEGDSNLSDGSDMVSNSEDDEDEMENEGSDEDEEEQDEGEDREDNGGSENAKKVQKNDPNVEDEDEDDQQYALPQGMENTFGANDFDELTHSIPLTMDNEDEEEDDDSGVEYD